MLFGLENKSSSSVCNVPSSIAHQVFETKANEVDESTVYIAIYCFVAGNLQVTTSDFRTIAQSWCTTFHFGQVHERIPSESTQKQLKIYKEKEIITRLSAFDGLQSRRATLLCCS